MLSSNNLNYVADMMKKQRATPISEFEITHESSTRTWHVEGAGLQRFVQMTNWRYNFVSLISYTAFSRCIMVELRYPICTR